MSMNPAKWTLVHTDKEGAVTIRRNAVIEDMGPDWISVETQGGWTVRIPLLQLQEMKRQEEQA